jgi:uncharacterized protein
MSRRLKLFLAASLGVATFGAGVAYALQADAAAALRATGKVGEQADGYLGIVGGADAALRAEVNAINIKRRAHYTELAARRGAKIEEVAATTACELFRTRVGPGQFFRGTDGQWRQRDGSSPVPLPSYCG